MFPSIVTAALSLGLALNAAAPIVHKSSVSHAKYVTVSDGFTSKKLKLPTLHHYSKTPKGAPSSGSSSSAGPKAPAAANGCYEVTANFGLVPCGSHPHG